MAHVLAQTRLDAVLDNRPATLLGGAGTAVVGLLAGLLLYGSTGAIPDPAPEELPFAPAMIMALGSPDDFLPATEPSTSPAEPTEPDTPEPDVTDDAPTTDDEDASDAEAPETVSDDADVPTRPTTKPPRPTTKPPRPTSPGDKLPTLPGPKGPPTPPGRGDPFGSPTGFSDLERAGDPWAGELLAAIEAMKVGTVYAEPIQGTVRFRITLCKDGTISRASYKGGTADIDGRDRVLHEIERLKLRPLPASVAAGMSSRCATVKHTFSWTHGGTR